MEERERTKDSSGTSTADGEGKERINRRTRVESLKQEIVARFRSWFDRGREEGSGHGACNASER